MKLLRLDVYKRQGSDHVLQLMRRHYTLQEYKDLIAKLRSRIKDLSITTDIIAGFPQETDEDFEERCV